MPDDCNVVVGGDFNAPDVHWCMLTTSYPSSSFLCNTIFDKNLVQLITQGTHKCGNILDLVLSNSQDRTNFVVVDKELCRSISDHYPVNCF